MSGAIQPITPYQAPDILGQAGQVAGIQNQLLGNQTAQQNLQLQQYQINQAQLAQVQARLAPYKAGLGTLLSLGSNIQPSDVYNNLRQQSAAGTPTDAIAGDVAASMPVMDPSHMNDPGYKAQYGQALHSWVQQQWGSTLTPEAQANVFRPNVSLVNTGGSVQAIDTNPTTNSGAVGSSLQNTLSPAEAISGRDLQTPGGVPYFEPNAAIAAQTGQGNLVAGGAGAPPAGNSIFGTGRLPGRGAPYSGPQAGSAASLSSAVPPGTIQTGPSVATAAALPVAGAGSAADLVSLQRSQQGAGARLYQLQTSLSALQSLGTSGTGPGTAERNGIVSYLQSVPGVANILGIDPSKIANFDEATKYLTQYASSQAASTGAETDSKLATALSGNASTHISNLAATNVVKASIGLERMGQAESAAFTASGQPPDQFDTFAANWNRTANPVAYSFDLMSPQDRSTYLKGLSGTARSSFLDQVWQASQNGFTDKGKLGFGSPAAASAAPLGQVPNPAASGQTYQPAVPVTP